MAYIRRHGDGWRAEIVRKGVRKSRVFTTKTAATAWATREESAIIDGTASRWPDKTLSQALGRYTREVTAGKRTARTEGLRFAALERDFPGLAGKLFHAVDSADLAAWRDARLKTVSRATVQREINSLRNVWTVAIREWKWVGESPWKTLRMPGDNPHRERLFSWREARAIMRRCHYLTGRPPLTGMEAVAYAVLVALRTGMRAGEIMGLEPADIDLAARVVTVRQHKTQHLTGKPRRVPLTRHGVRVLGLVLAGMEARQDGRVWPIGSTSLDALFRKARAGCGIEGLHFHDARATFATHMARKVDALTLAKIMGHSDVRMVMVYFRETEEDIARRL